MCRRLLPPSIAHMMEKEPDERYASCAAVLADLQRFAKAVPLGSRLLARIPMRRQLNCHPNRMHADKPLRVFHAIIWPTTWNRAFSTAAGQPWQRAKDWGSDNLSPPCAAIPSGDAGHDLADGCGRGPFSAALRSAGKSIGGSRSIETELSGQNRITIGGRRRLR